MNIKRVLASGMAALMAGSTLAMSGLGQTTSPTWTIADSADSLLAYVGSDASGGATVHVGAAEQEVLAAANGLDLSKTTFADAIAKVRTSTGTVKQATSTGSTAQGGGTQKDLNFGAGTSGGTALTAGVNAFPSGQWSNAIVPQLMSGKVSWKGSDYDFKEVLSTTGVTVRNDVGTDNVNGTLTLQVDSSDIYLAYRFDKALNITTANGKGNKETSDFETTDPVEISFLGKKFQIIGIAAGKLIVLNGAIGKSLTPTNGIEYTTAAGKKYTVYATEGSDNSWAKVSVKDSTGAEVESATINKGASKDFDKLDLTIEVTAVRAKQDNSVSGVDLVVGPKGKTKKTIDTSGDVTSTGTSNDALFEGFPDWGLETSGAFANGQASASDELRLTYKPSSTKYLKEGQEVKMPANMRFLNNGFNQKTFAKITIAAVNSGVSIENKTTGGSGSVTLTTGSTSSGTWNGISIESDTTSTVGRAYGNVYYSGMGIFFNRLLGLADGDNGGDAEYPVLIAYKDGGTWKGNGTALNVSGAAAPSNLLLQGVDSLLVFTNGTSSSASSNNNFTAGFNYTFALNLNGAAERTWYINTSLGMISNSTIGSVGALGSPTTPIRMIIGRAGATGDTTARYGINITWENATRWGADNTPTFRLGSTITSSEDRDLYISTEATADATGQAVGKKSQTILDNSGLQIENPASTTGSDKVVILLPSKELQASVFVGAQATTGTPMYSTPAEVLAQVKAGTLTKNLILVGGPCANEVVEYLATAGTNDTLPTCAEWTGGAAPKYTKGLIGVWNVGTTGKKALVIAGTAKADTDSLASDFKLKGTTSFGPQ